MAQHNATDAMDALAQRFDQQMADDAREIMTDSELVTAAFGSEA
jgi:hypothetical protein